mmetsp:Transcript_1276/g.2643  ORF Transcript_1276/g.2643 Transcript_1276/m.2643 type:complete len:244 (-) Transcript_1276:4028-4759(-)
MQLSRPPSLLTTLLTSCSPAFSLLSWSTTTRCSLLPPLSNYSKRSEELAAFHTPDALPSCAFHTMHQPKQATQKNHREKRVLGVETTPLHARGLFSLHGGCVEMAWCSNVTDDRKGNSNEAVFSPPTRAPPHCSVAQHRAKGQLPLLRAKEGLARSVAFWTEGEQKKRLPASNSLGQAACDPQPCGQTSLCMHEGIHHPSSLACPFRKENESLAFPSSRLVRKRKGRLHASLTHRLAFCSCLS